MLQGEYWIPLGAAIAAFLIIHIASSENREKEKYRYFMPVLKSIFVWMGAATFLNMMKSEEAAMFFTKINWFGAIMVVFSFAFWVLNMTGERVEKPSNKTARLLFFAAPIIPTITLILGVWLEGVEKLESFESVLNIKWFLIIVLPYFLVFMALSYGYCLKIFLNSFSALKKFSFLVLISTLPFILVTVITNFVIPMFDNSAPRYADHAAIIWMLVMFYAIEKYGTKLYRNVSPKLDLSKIREGIQNGELCKMGIYDSALCFRQYVLRACPSSIVILPRGLEKEVEIPEFIRVFTVWQSANSFLSYETIMRHLREYLYELIANDTDTVIYFICKDIEKGNKTVETALSGFDKGFLKKRGIKLIMCNEQIIDAESFIEKHLEDLL